MGIGNERLMDGDCKVPWSKAIVLLGKGDCLQEVGFLRLKINTG